MRKSGVPWLFVLICMAVAGAAFWWWQREPSQAVRTARVREVMEGAAGALAPQTLLNASGYVTARRAATVSSKVMGKVMEVLIERLLDERHALAQIRASHSPHPERPRRMPRFQAPVLRWRAAMRIRHTPQPTPQPP